VLANLCSLRDPLVQYLKGEQLDKPFDDALLKELTEFPIFPSFSGDKNLALKTILTFEPPDKVFAYSISAEEIEAVPAHYRGVVILKEVFYPYDALWGGHEYYLIDYILKRILEGLGYELLKLNSHLAWDDDKLKALKKRGVLEMSSLSIRPCEAGKQAEVFLKDLKRTLNQPWFKKAVTRFRPPSQIHLMPMTVEEERHRRHLVAAILKKGRRDELYIGLNFESSIMRRVSRIKNGVFTFLPIMCHEMAHRPALSVAGEEQHHGPSFYDLKIQLEDRVIGQAVRYLLGKRDSDWDETSEEELIVI